MLGNRERAYQLCGGKHSIRLPGDRSTSGTGSASSRNGVSCGRLSHSTARNGMASSQAFPPFASRDKRDTSPPGRRPGHGAVHTGLPIGISAVSWSRSTSAHKGRSPLPSLKRSPANWRYGPLLNLKIPAKMPQNVKKRMHVFLVN